MADFSSGIPLPSRDAQEVASGRAWTSVASEPTDAANAKASLALAILSEKIKSGAMRRSELMQRIVAQAFAATPAKGVALALRSAADAGVVCYACEGEMAPPPGTPLDESSGFTAECLRKGAFIVCEDAETDDRVDRAACARLGVRSIVAVPVENEGATVGVLEALSDQQAAFSKQHIEVLLTLACFAKSVMSGPGASVVPRQAPVMPEMKTFPADAVTLTGVDLASRPEDSRDWSQRVPRRVRLALAGAVAAALLLALFATAIWLWMWRQNARTDVGKTKTPRPLQVSSPKPGPGLAGKLPSRTSVVRTRSETGRKSILSKASAVEKIRTAKADDDMRDTVEVPAAEEDAVAPAAFTPLAKVGGGELSNVLSSTEPLPSVAVPTSQGATPARLQHRVEPVYPADARRLRVEGAVVLRASIDEGGKVKAVQLVDGNPLLANAAITAVRQWRYSPSQLNHRPTAITTDITIVFHLQ